MTLGWHIGNLSGQQFFYREGGGGGFHCTMRLNSGDRVGTVVMTNATGFDVRNLLDTIDPTVLARSADLCAGLPKEGGSTISRSASRVLNDETEGDRGR